MSRSSQPPRRDLVDAKVSAHELPRLHAIAADWFEGHGRPTQAVRHAAQAHEDSRALALTNLGIADPARVMRLP